MRRLGWSLLVLLAIAPLSAGCGTEAGSLHGSGDAPNDASSSRIEWKEEGKGMPEWALTRATGSMDYAHRRGEMVIKGKSDSAPEARAVLIDHHAYLGVAVGPKTYWLKQSAEDPTGADSFVPGAGGITPERVLDELVKSSSTVDKLDSEEIRGVSTTHYRAHLDKTKPGSGILEGEPGIVDAWIDDQGLPRRMRVPQGGEHEAAVVFDLFDFGVPVDVEAPPANEIVSEKEFEKMMKEECAGAGTDLDNANVLCMAWGGSISESHSYEVSPTETLPTTDGK
jgi:hypothetical protein